MKLDKKIFEKEDNIMDAKQGEGRIETIIGKGTSIEGTVNIEGATRIDGSVNGKLVSNDIITVGPTGIVKAEVRAKAIIVGGKVEGNLIASEKVELQSKSELIGDIASKSLLVEHGAIFHGSSRMKDSVPAPAPTASQPKPEGFRPQEKRA